MSEKGHPLSESKLAQLWEELLQLHMSSPRPGRAAATCDVTYMMEHGKFRITVLGTNSASSADGPRAARELGALERTAIQGWCDGYMTGARATNPHLHELETSLAAQADHNVGVLLDAVVELKDEHVKPRRDMRLFLKTGQLPDKLLLVDKATGAPVFDKEGNPVFCNAAQTILEMQRWTKGLHTSIGAHEVQHSAEDA
jgi:hypothetical protein